MATSPTNTAAAACPADCLGRRTFLATAGSVVASTLGLTFPDRVLAQDTDIPVSVTSLERQKLGALSLLKTGQTLQVDYPDEQSPCMLIQTGQRSGGGIGPNQDVVAFSSRCTHMGGSLADEYNAEHCVAGPCRLHLTTFDLTRHGIVVAGHATQALPQLILELDGDDIYATGITGLLYGHAQNDSRA